jgi:uncharacterized protein (TIGR03437 family)
VISTIAGGGPPAAPVAATNVSTGFVGREGAVAADAAGDIYFTSLNCAFKVDPNGVLTRVAGNSRAGFSGDGGPAVNAQLNGPSGIAVDSAGNVLIADSRNNRIRKVSSNGIITTLAGNGTLGYSGDGGTATHAQLTGPGAVAVDSAGNLWFTDNLRVRKVSPDGVITTVAGTGVQGLSGDGGPATSAQFWFLGSLVTDTAGNLFIADSGSNRVRKVSSGGTITTVAGNGSGSYSGDGGPAVNAQLGEPEGLALDGAGNLFIGDYVNHRIRRVDSRGIITTVAGSGNPGYSGDGGPAVGAQLSGPTGVAVDGAGNVFLVDTFNSRIRKISSGGIITTAAGNGFYSYSGDGGPATSAQLYGPSGVALDGNGNLFIADSGNNRVRQLSSNGVITGVAGNSPSCAAPFGPPAGPCGGYSGDGAVATSAQLNHPGGVAVDSAGNLFIADSGNNRIRKVSLDGILSTVAGTAGVGSQAVVVDGAGDLFMADGANSRVLKVSPGGTVTTVAGSTACPADDICYSGDGGPAIGAQLSYPIGLALDNAGNLFIADYYESRLRKVSPNGIITTVAGGGSSGLGDGGPAASAQLNGPSGIAMDRAGNLFIAESNRIRKLSPAGIITTVAGSGPCSYTNCFSGDGGPASNAQLDHPSAVAVDSAGNVYVADSGNGAIRLLEPVGPPFSSAVSVNGVTSAASNLAGAVSPGEMVVLYGTGIGPGQLAPLQLDAAGRVATTLAGTQVWFNGIPGPVVYTSSTQVAAVVPYEVNGTTVQVQVSYQGQTSEPVTVPLAASVPAVFSRDSSGQGQAAALNQDLSINDAAHPAPIGSAISLFATGEGQTSPGGSDGQIAGPSLPQPILPLSVTIGGMPANIRYAGGVLGEVAGSMQVNVQVPPGVQPGTAVAVMLTVGGASSQPGITIAVSQP